MLNLPLRAKGIIVQHFNTDPGQAGALRRRRAELVRMHLSSIAAPASSSSKTLPNTGADTMDDRTHHHGAHGHGGRAHVHASVDHLANEFGNSSAAGDPPRRRADAEARRRRRRHRARRDRTRPQHPGAARPAARRPTRTPASCGSTASCGRRSRRISTSRSRSRRRRSARSSASSCNAGGRRLDGARPRAAPQEACWSRAARRPASARCSTSPSRTRTPARPTRSTRSSDGPGVVDETTEVVLNYHDCASAGRRVRRHLRGRRRPRQADQADPRAGAASAHLPARLSPSRHQSAARHHPLRAARAPAKRISRARSPTRSTRASTTSTVPT